MKVVFHIDELNKWETTKGNITNLLALKLDIEIRVVVNGQAILGYLVDENADFVSQHPSVTFQACQNAMNSHDVKTDQLPLRTKIVPSGVLAIIKAEEAGFGYIKP
ncbi:MAG: sulfur reduction protein DsrE [Oenococcus sp.]|uniref:DsrE family protein n=1 Tax=Oenococcus sp. TaxID=1979414 RepID=UPI0039EA1FC1